MAGRESQQPRAMRSTPMGHDLVGGEPPTVIVSLVRFKSKLHDGTVHLTFAARSEPLPKRAGPHREDLRALPPRTGEFGAVYLWESEENFDRFRQNKLGRTVADVYQVGDSLSPSSPTYP